MSRPLLLAVTCILLGLSLNPAAANDACRLRVGWEHWHPYIYHENGAFKGSEYELLTELAAAADCELVFLEVPWARALYELENGKLELLYGASKTAERSKYANFSEPYRYDGMSLLTFETYPVLKISLKEYLLEKSVPQNMPPLGLIRGFYYGEDLQPILDGFEKTGAYTHVRHDDQLLGMLMAGRLSGYLLNSGVVASHIKNSDGKLRAYAITEARPEPMHLMFSKSLPSEIVARFDQEISNRQGKPAK